jgi:polar amino acid transport system substrate-binding protein
MIRRHLPLGFLLAATLAASASVAGPPAGRLRLCADPDNLPFSSASGPERGFYLDVGALVAARLGMTPEVVWWRTFYGARAVRNTLLADTCDAYVGLPSDAGYMDKRVGVTRPFLDVGYAIMAPPSVTVARLDDLKPYRLAVEFRSPPQSLVATRDGFSVSTFRTAEEAVDALGRGEVDAAFVWGPIAGYLNGVKFKGAYRVVPVAGEGMQWRVAIGVRKEDEALRQRLDDALGQLGPEIRRAAEHYGFPLTAPVDLAAAPPALAASQAVPGAPAATAGGPSAAEPSAPGGAAPPAEPSGPGAPGGGASPAQPSPRSTPDTVAAGRAVFNQLCSHCHSPNAYSPEPSRDLRRLRIRYGERMTAVFYETVTQGRVTRGMPSWKEILKQDDLAKILSFLESVQSSP